MGEWSIPVALLLLVVAAVCGTYLVNGAIAVGDGPVFVAPFLSGLDPSEHAVSRFHARWYSVTLLFLAFDVEMLFMYPWALVVGSMGTSAIVEMFVFLALLMVGVLYAWREGALAWA